MPHPSSSERAETSLRHDEPRRTAQATRLVAATWERELPEDPLAAPHPARPGSTTDALNRVAELAARLLDTPHAQVSLIAAEQHVVGGHGLAPGTIGGASPTDHSMCTVTTRLASPLAVVDARADSRVNALPPVTSGAVGAYLGVPLVTREGFVVGALCAFAPKPRVWLDRDVVALEAMAEQVMVELELAVDTADLHDDRLVWRLAVDAAGVGAFDWHLTTNQLRWDDRLLALFGLTRETFGGTVEAFNELLHPEDVDRVSAALDRAIDTCGPYEAEYRVIWPSGEVRWIGAKGQVLAGPDGLAVKLVGAAYDTTQVREGDARVARVLESMPTAFYQLDDEWRFTFVNTEAERLLGKSRDELLGGSVWELFPAAAGTIFEDRYFQAVASGEPVAFDAYYPPPLDGWYEVRAWPSPDGLAVYFSDITGRHKAQEQLDFAARRSEILASLTGALTSTLDIEEAVRTLAPLVTPSLADWCLVTVVEGDHEGALDWRSGLRDVAFWHGEPTLRPTLEAYAEARLDSLTDDSFLAHALDSDGPLVIPTPAVDSVLGVLADGPARGLLAELDPHAGVIVPLRGRGRVVGLLSLYRNAARGEFSDADLALLEDISVRAGLALDNARLFGQQREVAEALQRSLLGDPRHDAELELAVRYEPAADAAQVGGDWYDAFVMADGSTTLVIGDVVGHDIIAAAAMGQIRNLVRGIAYHTDEGPAALLSGVDRTMVGLEADTTATAVVGRLEPGSSDGSHRLTWSNAGHPPPMVLRADGTAEVLQASETDLLLGLAPELPRHEQAAELAPGDTLVLYTDGLVERRIAGLDAGLEELQRMLVALGPDRTPDDVAERVLRGLMPYRADDDVALLVVRVSR